MSTRPWSALPALVLTLIGVAACGADDASTTNPTPATSTTAPSIQASISVTATSPATGSSAALANDICELLTDADVEGIIGPATHAADASFGSLGSAGGGRCVWTSDPGGDPLAAGAANVELVAWMPGELNPPPAQAPPVGSADVMLFGNGASFATADRLFLIRVTGTKASDSAAVHQAVALIPAVKGRV